MVSIDTNIAVRLLVNDDPDQTSRAAALFKSNQVFIAKTVALETEWILRGVYKIDKEHVNSALTALFSLVNVQVEDSAALFSALMHHAHGMDFADALHFSSSQRADTFATFDVKLRTRAKKLQLKQEVIVP
jgi:predicted nucleic-acid-binding protein